MKILKVIFSIRSGAGNTNFSVDNVLTLKSEISPNFVVLDFRIKISDCISIIIRMLNLLVI